MSEFESVILVMLAWAVFCYLILSIPTMKFLEKAGCDKTWRAWIPIYNIYLLFDIFWEKKFFWIYIGICIGMQLVPTPNDLTMAIIGAVISFVAILAILIPFEISVAKSFGKGVGTIIGLILVTPIFYFILAFGKSEYAGPYSFSKKKEAYIEYETTDAMSNSKDRD